jgi:RHS repeat-associated protein
LSQTVAPLTATDVYTYDGANRILTAGEASVWTQTYAYDQWGNRAVVSGASYSTYIPNPGFTPQVTSPTAALPYTNNQWTGATYDPTSTGNMMAVNGMSFTYDAENRQTSLAMNGNPNTGSYSYDGEGRRVMQVMGGVSTVYVYDAMGQLAAEYSQAGPVALCNTSYTCYFTGDHLGSTRVITDANGNVMTRHDYLPFGEEIFTTNRTTALKYTQDSITQKFTGKERDTFPDGTPTGLDFFGARYFSAAQGRFTSPDKPLIGQYEADPQSWNLYTYVRNNPLRYRDPDGLDYHVCVDDGKGGQSCTEMNDAQYKAIYDQQNGKQGISMPIGMPGGAITCGGTVCGSATFYENWGSMDRESFSIGLGFLGGKAASAALSKAFGWLAGLFGRAGTTAAATTTSELLVGKVLAGFSAAQEAMIQRSLAALEAAGYNTGRLQTLIRIVDAPADLAGMSLPDGPLYQTKHFRRKRC